MTEFCSIILKYYFGGMARMLAAYKYHNWISLEMSSKLDSVIDAAPIGWIKKTDVAWFDSKGLKRRQFLEQIL